jgi:hypothetical protein
LPVWSAFLLSSRECLQAILRHSNVGLTINVHVKSLAESQVNATDPLSAELGKETGNDLATRENGLLS